MARQNKFCQACGAPLADNAKFCGECGAKYEAPARENAENDFKTTMLLRKMVYSVPEAAKSLGISVRFVTKLIAEGELTACRQGRKVGITEWALEEYAKKKEITCDTSLRGELKII